MYESAPAVPLHLIVCKLKLAIIPTENRELPMGTQEGSSVTMGVFSALARLQLNMFVCLGS